MNFAAIERSAPKLEPCCCNRRLRLFILLCFLPIFFESPLFTLIHFPHPTSFSFGQWKIIKQHIKTTSLSNLMPESFKYPIRWARVSGLLDFKVLIRAYFAKCFMLGMLFLFWINEQYCCLKSFMYFKQSV